MAELSKAEQRWLTGLRPNTADRRPGRLLGRAQKAADRWSIEAGYIAVGLTAASADGAPPVAPSGDRGRTVGYGDPVASAYGATVRHVESAARRWAHLTADCAPDCTACGGPNGWRLAAQTAADVPDPADIVDGLLGTPPSSTAAWQAAVSRAATWHTIAAATISGAVVTMWRRGAETVAVEDAVAGMEQLARLTAGVAGSLSEWNGRQEPTCRIEGCRRPREPGRRVCMPCRKGRRVSA